MNARQKAKKYKRELEQLKAYMDATKPFNISVRSDIPIKRFRTVQEFSTYYMPTDDILKDLIIDSLFYNKDLRNAVQVCELRPIHPDTRRFMTQLNVVPCMLPHISEVDYE